jgi:AraC-like DNA-binding protein
MSFDVRINPGGGIYSTSPDWVWGSPKAAEFRDFDLWLVREGEARITIEGEAERHISAGACYLFHPGVRFKAWNERSFPIKVYALHFDFIRRGKVFIPGKFPKLYRRMRSLSLVEALMLKSITAWRAGEDEAAGLWLKAALQSLDDEDKFEETDENARAGEIADICAAVRDNPGAPFRTSEAARKLGLCADHFTRVFRAVTGRTPKAFLLKARAEAARGMLLSSNLSCSRIGELCGFSSPQHFHRTFFRLAGVTPAEFRRGRQ